MSYRWHKFRLIGKKLEEKLLKNRTKKYEHRNTIQFSFSPIRRYTGASPCSCYDDQFITAKKENTETKKAKEEERNCWSIDPRDH